MNFCNSQKLPGSLNFSPILPPFGVSKKRKRPNPCCVLLKDFPRESFVSRRGTCSVEPLRGGSRRQLADTTPPSHCKFAATFPGTIQLDFYYHVAAPESRWEYWLLIRLNRFDLILQNSVLENVHLSKVTKFFVYRCYSLTVRLLIFSGTQFSQPCFSYSRKCTSEGEVGSWFRPQHARRRVRATKRESARRRGKVRGRSSEKDAIAVDRQWAHVLSLTEYPFLAPVVNQHLVGRLHSLCIVLSVEM
jgi:hypothetical protein